jgi:hypothetical protein
MRAKRHPAKPIKNKRAAYESKIFLVLLTKLKAIRKSATYLKKAILSFKKYDPSTIKPTNNNQMEKKRITVGLCAKSNKSFIPDNHNLFLK